MPISKPKIKCKRCGKCCIVLQSDGTYGDCPYLVRYIDGTTFCQIYRHRIEAIIGEKQFCGNRDKWVFNIPDCPYNKISLPVHPYYKKQ